MLTSLSANRTAGKLLIVLVATTLLAGCGRKPGDVEPPQGGAPNTYPQTYPPLDGH